MPEKICPFCRKSISLTDSKCPYCTRVLREKIHINQPSDSLNNNNQRIKNKDKNEFISFFKFQIGRLKNIFSHKKTLVVGHNHYDKYKKFILFFSSLLFIIGLAIRERANDLYIPPSVIPDHSENTTTEIRDSMPTQAKVPKDYASLRSGEVLSRNAFYFNGLGELTIDNGTDLDAIAKLVNISTDKSVFTVYIKAKSIYSISNVSDGSYKLFFNLGNDWDANIMAFSVNSSYEVFEENFDFRTMNYREGDYIRTRYSTFNVTLNPIFGGQAKTDEINATEFGNY